MDDPWHSRCPVLIQPDRGIIQDLSYNRTSITAAGNAALSATQSKFCGKSIYFDGNGDYLQIPYLSDYNLVGYDFTIEAWIYVTALTAGNQAILCKDELSGATYPQYALGINSTGKFFGGVGTGAGATGWQSLTAGTALSLNEWHHVAFCRCGTVLYLFVDGLSAATPATQTAAMSTNTRDLLIGFALGYSSAANFNGYIEMVRITKGIARYVSPYSVPTKEITVTRQ